MAPESGDFECKTRANHYKGRFRIAMGGHMGLKTGDGPVALVFRAHPYFQRRYELQIPLVDIASVCGGVEPARLTVELSDGSSEQFRIGARTGLLSALERKRANLERWGSATQRGATHDRSDDDGRYWATGSYDPDRYHRETSGWTKEYLDYVRDSYGDLDTYNANKPD